MYKHVNTGRIICSDCECDIDGDNLGHIESGYQLIKKSSDDPKKIKVRKYLTGSKIDFMLRFYKAIDDIIDTKALTDGIAVVEMTEAEWVGEIMKRTRGALNPWMIVEELKNLND